MSVSPPAAEQLPTVASEPTQPKPSPRLAHRADVDGLRAVAVLPVVAFHAGIVKVPGGFVGVDVFFVISGFLISSLLIKEIEAGKFSIVNFYERRIRRIFPALFVVLLATFLMAWVYSLPSELIDLSKSSMAALLSVSNIYFWLKAGYFDGSALSEPLLHTWSLAVEEQFYIVWPLYLWLAFRVMARRPVGLTIVIALVSFALSVYGVNHDKDATYYLVPTRGWELLLGGLVALGVFPMPRAQWLRELLAMVGLALIVASVFLINGDMPFPGALALPSTAGAALLIAVGGLGTPTLVGRLLSWAPVTFIGLISYSLYLWHWPIAVFQRNSSMVIAVGPDWLRKLAIIFVSIIAAYLSWKFVEQPIRSGRYKPSPRTLWQLSAAAAVVIIAISGVFWSTQGLPARFSPRQIELASYLRFDPTQMFRDGECFLRERVGSTEVAPGCIQLAADKPNYLIMGDSHAAQLWWGLHQALPALNFAQYTAVGCLPEHRDRSGESARCRAAINRAFALWAGNASIHHAIIAGRWTPDSLPGISAMLDWAAQKNLKPILIGPSVIYDAPLPRLLVTAYAKDKADADPDRHWDRTLIALDRDMAALAKQKGAAYFSLINAVCDTAGCITLAGTAPLVFDREHFTPEGSILIAQKMQAQGLLAR